MPEDSANAGPTPANYQRTTGGHLRWQPPSPERLQQLLPAYEILSIVGQGGMGAVHQGRQKSLDRLVAIKLLPPEAADNDMQFIERFKNEARTMARMNHPAIVHVYDFGETSDGQLYIVMEYIDGTDVARMIQSQGKLPPEHALAITAHVCDALHYAHTHGVVHRDIKPANILLNMEGQVKVADFGLAKTNETDQEGLTKTNMAMGTPDFVAPEALTPGMTVDSRADLYAVGVMLYNMLTGQVPRGAFHMPSVINATDLRFDKIISKAMQMDRELRYQNAIDIRRDLDVILTTPQAKVGVQTISVKPRDLPQKPVAKAPGTSPQQPRMAGTVGAPARSQQPPTGGAPARPGPQPARKTAQNAQPPAEPAPKKSGAGMIYGIVALVVIVAAAGFMAMQGGKKPEAKPVAQSTPAEKSKPGASSKPLSGTFMLDVKDAELSGGEDDFKREAFKDHFLVKGWFPGSRSHPQSILSWQNVQVAAGEYEVVFTAAGVDSREFDLQLNVGKGRLSVNGFRPGTDSENATKDFPVGRIKLTSTASGVDLVCTKWSLAKSGMGSTFLLRRIRFSPVAKTVPAPATPSPPAANPILTFAGHRYQLVTEKLQWEAAKAKAESMGGHLATITTKEENDWVSKNILPQIKKTADDSFSDRIYIGASQKAAKDPWKWVTGEPFSFQPWMGNFPDNKSGGGVVATASPKGWDDVQWNFSAQCFLVEWDDTAPAKPAPLVLTSPVNLLAFVDVKRDAVYGDWSLGANGLELKQASGVKLLGFNQSLPEEYDFEIEFTPAKGKREVIQVLPVAGGMAVQWQMGIGKDDPPFFAFGPLLDGKKPEDSKRTEAVMKHERLVADQRQVSIVEVRKGSLRALLDGKELLKWSGDLKRLSIEKSSAFHLREPSQAGVGGHDSGILFHKAELRPPSAAPVATEMVKPAEPAPKPIPMPAPAPAEPAPPADPRLAQLEAGYQARYDSDAQKPFLAAVAALNQSYVANGIARARAAAQAKGSLAEINTLDAEKAAIEAGRGVPAEDAADVPESLKTLRSTYRSVLAQYTAKRDAAAAPLLQLYLGALDAYVSELTKAGKIDEARQVQALRDAKAQPPPPAETAAATPSSPPAADGSAFTNSLGMKFVPVKGTNTMFCIHETRRQDYAAYAAENPSVDGSWKSANRNSVPVGDKDDHPVVRVNWDEAHKFCEWLSKKEGRTYRLPTDEEWSAAVGIGHQENRRKESTPESLRTGVKDEYPWGESFPPKSKDKAGNYKDEAYAEVFKTKPILEGFDDGFATTAPVMSFKPNKLGIYDLGGNVDEWVEDWYNEAQKERTTRGMNWYSGGNAAQDMLSSYRGHFPTNDHNIVVGFRIVLEAPKKGP